MIAQTVEQALSAGIFAVCGVRDSLRFSLPARAAAASCPLLTEDAADCAARLSAARDRFLPVLGAPLVLAVAEENGWLLFTFTDAFYTALTAHMLCTLPPVDGDGGDHLKNRLMGLARKPRCGCPQDPAAQRAVWLAALCCERSGRLTDARRAAQALFTAKKPAARAAFLARCADPADAALRALAWAQACACERDALRQRARQGADATRAPRIAGAEQDNIRKGL